MYFRDREDAGRRLAWALSGYQGERPVVLALPRGGVVVGFEVARALRAPLDVLVVRKIGAPHEPELGIGALAEDGTLVAETDLIAQFGISQAKLERLAQLKRAEIDERVRRYRALRPLTDVAGRTVIIVDDGLATGVTARAAVRALRGKGPRRLILAVPLAAPETAQALSQQVDELVCLEWPEHLVAIGHWYLDFRQVTDEEVCELLTLARRDLEAGEPAAPL